MTFSFNHNDLQKLNVGGQSPLQLPTDTKAKKMQTTITIIQNIGFLAFSSLYSLSFLIGAIAMM